MNTYIDIHAIQTLPPSNINRDDTGAPKTATFGGVPRQRVSSQAWKRAIRKDFETYLSPNQLGVRTKRVVDEVAARILKIDSGWDLERARTAATAIFTAAKIKVEVQKPKNGEEPAGAQSGYLMFLSARQIANAAKFAIEHEGEKIGKKEAEALLDQDHSIDIAMFGRMIADAADFNVDAAVQVSHALGVSAAEPEFDFFTAVDDVVEDAEETGAGMLGTVQMMSSSLYRFASTDMNSLATNLGGHAEAITSATAFVKSFIRSLPTGKLNTFANWSLPDLVYVTVRNDRPVTLVNAFESPVVTEPGEDRRAAAAAKLAQEARDIEEAYGDRPVAAWVFGLGKLVEPFEGLAERVSQPQLLEAIETHLNEAG